VRLRSLVPLVQVRSVPRSIEFYAKLGFSVRNTFTPDGAREPRWASLTQGGAELMIGSGDGAASPKPTVLLYLYSEDVAEARASLERAGVACGPIRYPFYSPNGEFEVEDPDGYTLVIT
jgi:hypothetical protein